MIPIPALARALGVAALAAPLLAGACPFRQGALEAPAPTDTREVLVRVGESQEAFDGDVRVHLVSLERGPKEARIVLRLDAGGQVQQSEFDMAWNATASEVVRLEPWAARLSGYPGVDSARVAVWRESP
ncbi:MAG TPA: hypothetical protein VM778_06965 [Gemmatimonadota bacterium]|nr:hypothetical protein [Gemmatimonadota bacterium]